jgi:hypothetical protein
LPDVLRTIVFIKEELESRYRDVLRPRLVNPPLEFNSFIDLIDEYVLWLATVEDADLDEERGALKSDASNLIVEGFRKGVASRTYTFKKRDGVDETFRRDCDVNRILGIRHTVRNRGWLQHH